jgi:hypothetical protein
VKSLLNLAVSEQLQWKKLLFTFLPAFFLVAFRWQLLVTLCDVATVFHSIFDLLRKLLVKKFIHVQLSRCRLAQALEVTGG